MPVALSESDKIIDLIPTDYQDMIERVGNTIINTKHRATSYCGAVALEVNLLDGIVDPRRCGCSLCRRKGRRYRYREFGSSGDKRS